MHIYRDNKFNKIVSLETIEVVPQLRMHLVNCKISVFYFDSTFFNNTYTLSSHLLDYVSALYLGGKYQVPTEQPQISPRGNITKRMVMKSAFIYLLICISASWDFIGRGSLFSCLNWPPRLRIMRQNGCSTASFQSRGTASQTVRAKLPLLFNWKCNGLWVPLKLQKKYDESSKMKFTSARFSKV